MPVPPNLLNRAGNGFTMPDAAASKEVRAFVTSSPSPAGPTPTPAQVERQATQDLARRVYEAGPSAGAEILQKANDKRPMYSPRPGSAK